MIQDVFSLASPIDWKLLEAETHPTFFQYLPRSKTDKAYAAMSLWKVPPYYYHATSCSDCQTGAPQFP